MKQKQKPIGPREARIKAGLTWRGLAKAANVSQATIKRAEDSGSYPANVNTRNAYMAALGVSA